MVLTVEPCPIDHAPKLFTPRETKRLDVSKDEVINDNHNL